MVIAATLFDTFVSTTGFTGNFSTTNSKTPLAHTVYLVGLVRSGSTTIAITTALTGWGITWSPVQRLLYSSDLRELTLWRGITDSPVTGVLTATYTGEAISTGEAVIAVALSGVDVSTPVPGTPTTIAATGTGSTFSQTYINAANAGLLLFGINLATGTPVTAETNWTSLADISHASPVVHLAMHFRANAGISNATCTPAWDGSSVGHGGIFVQLAPGADVGDDTGLSYMPIEEAA